MKDLSFNTAELLQAAAIAKIDPADIPSSASPWTWADQRARSWQLAFRSINPAVAEQAEIQHGPAISLALKAALDGLTPMTADLAAELSVKRPDQHREMQVAEVDAAIARIEESRQQERARRAELTPSPERLQQQLRRSREAAYASQRERHGALNP